MAKLTIDIPDDQKARVADAFARSYGYDGEPDDAEAKWRFARQKVVDYIVEVAQAVAVQDAQEAARESAAAKALVLK